MEILKNITQLNLNNTIVAIGKFDGIHKGHMLLMEEVLSGQKEGLNGIVFTFSNPPKSFIEGKDSKLIYSEEEKILHMNQLGINYLIEYPITEDFMNLSPKEFIQEILVNQLGVKAIVVGVDFRFGKNRSGSVEDLIKYSETYNYQVVAKEKLKIDDEIVSSTEIRKLIHKGEMREVVEVLGRHYSLYEEVIEGNKLGRTIQIPTANQLIPRDKIIPPYGVYATSINIDGIIYKGISNLGMKPTVNGKQLGLETHIFDFSEDIYHKKIEVSFIEYIRAERKFNSFQELNNQLISDIAHVKEKF